MSSLKNKILEIKSDFKVAIIGAMDEEVDILTKMIDRKNIIEIAGFTFYTGKMHDLEVVILKSDIGKVNASIGTTLLIERFKPNCIINTGSAGALNKKLNIGDVIIGSKTCYLDVDLTDFDYEFGQVPHMPSKFYSDLDMIDMASSMKLSKNIHLSEGLIASSDTFVHEQEVVDFIKEHFADIQACEMEASAIAQTCFRFNIPFIIFRAISDIVGKSNTQDFDANINLAGTNSAYVTAKMVSKISSFINN